MIFPRYIIISNPICVLNQVNDIMIWYVFSYFIANEFSSRVKSRKRKKKNLGHCSKLWNKRNQFDGIWNPFWYDSYVAYNVTFIECKCQDQNYVKVEIKKIEPYDLKIFKKSQRKQKHRKLIATANFKRLVLWGFYRVQIHVWCVYRYVSLIHVKYIIETHFTVQSTSRSMETIQSFTDHRTSYNASHNAT